MERIAHRGAKREFPENSLPAFQRAFELGADAVELDVHATRDGVVVVHHDPHVQGAGLHAEIASTAWTELRRHELAPGVHVPTLAEVLDLAPPDATVYVEIKGASIERAVAAVIRASTTKCAVHSFDHDAIARLQTIAPDIPRGVLFEKRGVDLARVLAVTGARDVWPNWKLIDRELIDRAHATGSRVIAWTVNDAAVATRLADLGTDGLCGDDVRLLPAGRLTSRV